MIDKMRRPLGMLVPGAALAGALAAYLSWHPRLPDRLPGLGDGGAGSTMSLAAFAAVTLALPAGVWLAGLAGFAFTARLPSSTAHSTRTTIQLLVTLTVLPMVTAHVLSLHAALDAPTPEEAAAPSTAALGGGLTVAILCALVLSLGLSGTRAPMGGAASVPAREAVRLPLERGEQAAWQETRTVPLVQWTAAFFTLLGIVLTVPLVIVTGGPGWSMLAITAAGLALLPLRTYRLAVDGGGVRASMGPVRRRIPMDHIVQAAPVVVEPHDWLLTGILRGATGNMVLAPGRALSLHLADGTEFLASCRDAPTAAGLINSIRDRAG